MWDMLKMTEMRKICECITCGRIVKQFGKLIKM